MTTVRGLRRSLRTARIPDIQARDADFCANEMTLVILCCRESKTRKKMLRANVAVARRSHSRTKLHASRRRHAAPRISRYHLSQRSDSDRRTSDQAESQ